MELRPVDVGNAGEIERAVTAFARSSNGGLIVTSSPSTAAHREPIVALAARHRLPAVYSFPYFATSGGLMSYGPARESRSSEKFMHGIKVLMAKNYVDNLSEETRKGMLEKAEQGIWPSFAPLGYRNLDGPDGKKIIAPDPDVAPIISKLFTVETVD